MTCDLLSGELFNGQNKMKFDECQVGMVPQDAAVMPSGGMPGAVNLATAAGNPTGVAGKMNRQEGFSLYRFVTFWPWRSRAC